MERREHWDRVFSTRELDEVSWYQGTPHSSLAMIERAGLRKDEPIVDVGCGASLLIDHLVGAGYEDVYAVDVSPTALDHVRTRLGERGEEVVTYLAGDVLELDIPEVSLWHDRAVFHFLTEEEDRERYRARLERSVRLYGTLVIGTFALDGPERCSGLPVQRWDADLLAAFFGDGWERMGSHEERHVTPGGASQHFVFARFRRLR